MSASFVIAVPAKGRLQENAEQFFARAGLDLIKPRGARDYRGTIADLPGVEVAYLSASEITQLIGQGAVHFGITGEDLVREMIADVDAKAVFITELGFGHANVVVAIPQAWIDVHIMADLDDVATDFRQRHGRKMLCGLLLAASAIPIFFSSTVFAKQTDSTKPVVVQPGAPGQPHRAP